MILHRCFAWDRRADERGRGGALFVAREYQGHGRHDNPAAYGALYLADREISAVVEQLARFRGRLFSAQLLDRRGTPLALAEIGLPDSAELVDLDEPRVLLDEELRPSQVATHDRAITQELALDVYRGHRAAAGICWWSTHESLWANATVFGRAARRLRVHAVRRLTPADDAVVAAAEFLGLA